MSRGSTVARTCSVSPAASVTRLKPTSLGVAPPRRPAVKYRHRRSTRRRQRSPARRAGCRPPLHTKSASAAANRRHTGAAPNMPNPYRCRARRSARCASRPVRSSRVRDRCCGNNRAGRTGSRSSMSAGPPRGRRGPKLARQHQSQNRADWIHGWTNPQRSAVTDSPPQTSRRTRRSNRPRPRRRTRCRRSSSRVLPRSNSAVRPRPARTTPSASRPA